MGMLRTLASTLFIEVPGFRVSITRNLGTMELFGGWRNNYLRSIYICNAIWTEKEL